MATRCAIAGALCLLVSCNPISFINGYMGLPDDNVFEEAAEYLMDMPDLTPDSPE